MKKEVKIALLVLAVIGIAFFGLNFLKGKNIFVAQDSYLAVYPRVDGLAVTNPVWINGFKVGQVSKIGFMPNSHDALLVAIRITNPNVKLNNNTVAKIISADILGSKGIDLLVNTGAPISGGDTLIGALEDGIMDVVSEQLAPLKAKAENMIVSIDSVLISLKTVLNETSLNDLGQSFHGIRGTFESLLASAKNLEGLIEDERPAISNALENISATTEVFKNNAGNLDASIKNIEKITGDIADSDLKATLNSVQQSMGRIQSILNDVEQGKGSLGKMIQTDELHTQINAAVADLEFLLEDMRINPNRYVNFSLIGRKDKGMGLNREEEKKLRNILRND